MRDGLVRLFVAALLPLLGLAWLQGEQRVTLVTPDGASVVHTHAATVAEVLDRAGVELAGVEVVPELDTQISGGMTIRVQPELALLAGRSRPAARAARSARLPALPNVTVTADGEQHEVGSVAATVGDVLAAMDIALDGDDRVTPAPDTSVTDGLSVVVRRVSVSEHTHEHPIPFDTVRRETPELPRGQEREVQPGRDGVLEVTERIVRVDGIEESHSRVGERVLRKPKTRVVEIGTAEPARTSAGAASRSSRPDPSPTPGPAPSPKPRRQQEGDASWYDHPEGGLTAAHRTLPFGTVLTVTNLSNGRQVKVTVNDRGPYVDGRVVDLSREAFSRIGKLGAGVVRVRITW